MSALLASYLCWWQLIGHLEDWLVLFIEPLGWLHGFSIRLGSSIGEVALIKCCRMHAFRLLDMHVLVVWSAFQIHSSRECF